MRAKAVVAALAVLGAGVVPLGPAAAQRSCATPTVNVLTDAEAAVSRPALRSPGEYALSNIYSLNQLATKPQFVYAEAGPQFAGAFEALAPAGSPPPPRAVSAHPSEDIPDEDTEDWGGSSTTATTPVSAFATSTGPGHLVEGLGDATVATSFVSTVVECDTVTIVAGWSANDVRLGPDLAFEVLGEIVTLVVGPTGSSATVETTALRSGETDSPLEGRPLDPFTDPVRDGGGPTIEAGEPRTETSGGRASATGGGFNFTLTDPETGQGASYRIGSVNATIEVLGRIAPPAVPSTVVTSEDTVSAPPVESTVIGTGASVTGDPPPASERAVAGMETALVRETTSMSIEVTHRSWLVVWALLGLLAATGAGWGTVAVGRRWFPTLDWIARRSARVSRRLIVQYLRW